MKYILIVSVVFMFSACGPDDQEALSTPIYFDLKAFAAEEGKLLSGQESLQFERSLFLDGKRETKTFPIAEVLTDLEVMAESDINKKAWIDKYEVSKTPFEETYTAKSNKLPVKLVKVSRDSTGRVTGIFTHAAKSNVLFNSQRNVEYTSGKSLIISGSQDVIIMGKDTFNIQVTIF